ncbi:unnamed protein product, partial [Tilletia laevis]
MFEKREEIFDLILRDLPEPAADEAQANPSNGTAEPASSTTEGTASTQGASTASAPQDEAALLSLRGNTTMMHHPSEACLSPLSNTSKHGHRWVGSPQPLLNDDQHSSMSLTQHRWMLELLHRYGREVCSSNGRGHRRLAAGCCRFRPWSFHPTRSPQDPVALPSARPLIVERSITFSVPTNGMVSKDIRDDGIFSHVISACPDPNSSTNQAWCSRAARDAVFHPVERASRSRTKSTPHFIRFHSSTAIGFDIILVGGSGSTTDAHALSFVQTQQALQSVGKLPARRFALLGHPIAHSLSPLLHNTGFGLLGLPHGYSRLETENIDDGAVEAFLRSPDFGGLSVTIPHKLAIMEKLDL